MLSGGLKSEGTGEDYMDISVSLKRIDFLHEELLSLLESLGLKGQKDLNYE